MSPSSLTAGCLRSTGAAAVAAVAALTLASSAAAEQDSQIVENTCNSDNQSGDDCVYTTAVKNNPDGIYVQFISSPDMCSNITARVGVGEPQPHIIGENDLAPGQPGTRFYIAGPGNAAGYSTVYVHAVGQNGGCNGGGLAEWAGTLHVEDRGYSEPPKAPGGG
jgi:hypothetical protein